MMAEKYDLNGEGIDNRVEEKEWKINNEKKQLANGNDEIVLIGRVDERKKNSVKSITG